ncbi:hypothetical protein LPN01_05435 [Sphingomonas sp. A2-49]|uniref:hypothetical protein n=1 Tax=Sphingomonas sp. A2-49 TaxID=1391375 RepID=UPI0021CE56C0|nr:hypothetical protein [Sphingomonas sp. A2-49]MCU6453514.1 hypothetical protein [Sphingomonas sp. A2-49]
MLLTFTKRDGKFDDLRVERDGLPSETVQCPKQGILPHDMIHYAVESTVTHKGFLSLLREGRPVAFTTSGGPMEAAVERLVETFQAEMWGGRVPAADLIAVYEHACGTDGPLVAPIAPAEVEAIRQTIDELTHAWSDLPVGQSLSVRF